MMRSRFALILALVIVAGCVVRDGKVFFNFPNVGPVNPQVDPNKKHEFRVLIVEDVRKRPELTAGQRAILAGRQVREFMRQHCTKGPDGEPEFRCFDYRDELTGESEKWKATFARSRSSLPWFYVENEKTGTEGPLSEDPDRFLQILEPFTKGE